MVPWRRPAASIRRAIVAEAKRIADFDVLCLQEIADNFPDPRLAGSDGEDQFAVLASLLARLSPPSRASRSISPARTAGGGASAT